jgi:hypothetical protein
VLLAGRDRFVSSYSRTSKASDPSAVASQGQTEVNQQRMQGQAQESDRERFVQTLGGASMIEVLKLALKALNAGEHAHLIMNTDGIKDKVRQAIAELESQEPVAWRIKVETKLRDGSVDVGYQLRNEKMSAYDEPLYTHQPQRTWVGLTDKEMIELFEKYGHKTAALLDAHEAKLKEKNNA